MAKHCPICGKKFGMLSKAKASDGNICSECARISSSHEFYSIETLIDFWRINDERRKLFTQTQKISKVLSIDAEHKLFLFGKSRKIKRPVVYQFNEVKGYEKETMGQKTVTKKKRGIGRALVGGAIAGGVGALVGVNTSKEVSKTVGGIDVLKVYIENHAGKSQHILSSSKRILSFLDICLMENEKTSNLDKSGSFTDEILKLKTLFDQGIITQEKFAEKKKQLLGL